MSSTEEQQLDEYVLSPEKDLQPSGFGHALLVKQRQQESLHVAQNHLQSNSRNNHDFFVDKHQHHQHPQLHYVYNEIISPSSFASSYFLLNYTNFNHGSFGACPQPVLDYQSMLRRQQEEQPDPFIRNSYKQLWNDTRVKIATSWKVPYQQMVLIESASTAVNSILRSFEWEAGDSILYFSTAYGMVKNTAQWLKQQYQLNIVEIPVHFPIVTVEDAYLRPLETALQDIFKNHHQRLRVAVLDHIVSIPAMKLPVQKMALIIRQAYATNMAAAAVESTTATTFVDDAPFILVDGAHAWGQVPNEEISDLILQHRTTTPMVMADDDNDDDDNQRYGHQNHNCLIDAYLSNGHKWMYSPKGSAVLWVHPSRITPTFPEPTVISSENSLQQGDSHYTYNIENITNDPMYYRFVYTSTKDYTSMLSMAAAMDFREHVLGGDQRIYSYVRNLAIHAKAYLMRIWETTLLVPDTMEEFMINVILPISKDDDDDDKAAVGRALQNWLYEQYNMYVVIAMEPSSGYMYTRLSAQVYLEMSDFERLGEAVLEFLGMTT